MLNQSKRSRLDQKHHYLPVFYLKGWAVNADGRLCEFNREHRTVKPRRTHPDGTGYFRGLYTVNGLAAGQENIVENEFLRLVDTAASQALVEMLEGQQRIEPSEMKTAWSRFMMSLLVRNPEALLEMQQQLHDKVRSLYSQTLRPDEPGNFEGHLGAYGASELNRLPKSLLVDLVQDSKVARAWTEMVWSILRLTNLKNELLTSDRPVVMNVLPIAEAHVCIPVGPSELFFASATKEGHRQLSAVPPTLVANTMNDAVTKQAFKFVYARTDKQCRFVDNRLGRYPRSWGLFPSLAP